MIRRNLKIFRVQHDYTQQDMADLLNISRNSYMKIENGKMFINEKVQNKIQSVFNLSDEEYLKLVRKEES